MQLAIDEAKCHTLHVIGHFDEKASVGGRNGKRTPRSNFMNCIMANKVKELVLYGCFGGEYTCEAHTQTTYSTTHVLPSLTGSASCSSGTVAGKYYNDAKEHGCQLSTAGIGDVYTDEHKDAKIACTAIQFDDTEIDEQLDNVNKFELISIPVRAACCMADVHALYAVAYPHLCVCRFSVCFGRSSR